MTRLRFPAGVGIFFLDVASGPALGPTQPPIRYVPGVVKRPYREADHLPSSAEVKNAWSYTSTPPIRLHGVAFWVVTPLSVVVGYREGGSYKIETLVSYYITPLRHHPENEFSTGSSNCFEV
jgi:hypothetical protein